MKMSKSRRRRIRKLVKGLRAQATDARAWAMPDKLRPYFTPEQWARKRIAVGVLLDAAADSQERRILPPASPE